MKRWLTAAVLALTACCALAEEGLRAGVIKRIIERPPETGTRIFIDFGGATSRARLLSVRTEGITVEVGGMELPLEWAKVSDKRLLGLLLKSAGEDAAALELAARFALAAGEKERAKEIAASLAERGVKVSGLDWGEEAAPEKVEASVSQPGEAGEAAKRAGLHADALFAVGPQGKPSAPLPIGVGEWAFETKYWWPRDYHGFSYANGSAEVWKKVLEARQQYEGKEAAPLETPQVSLSPPSSDREAGFISWPVHYSDLCPPGRIPAPEEAMSRTLSASAALGEVEPVTIAVRAVRSISGLKVEVTPLKAKWGATIPAGQLRVYFLECLYRRGRYADRAGGAHMRPGPLLEMPSWEPPVNSTRRIWINVHVPATAAPGDYVGKVTLKAQDGTPVEFMLEFKVYPFVLENPKAVRWSPYISNFLTRKDSPGAVEDHFAHGMNTASTWNGQFGFGGSAAAPQVDAAEFLKYLELLKQHGAIGPVALYCSGSSLRLDPQIEQAYGVRWPSEEFVTAFARVCKNVHEQTVAAKVPPIAFSLYDEQTQNNRYWEGFKRISKVIKENFPEVIVYATNHNEREANALKSETPDTADIWGTNRPNSDDAAFCRRQNIRYWTYTFCNNHVHPTAARYNTGLLPWVYGGVCTFLWANYWSDPEEQFYGGGKWTLTYYTPSGVVSSVNWENVREGVDDRKYVALLEYCAEECMRKGRATGAAQQALAWLDGAKKKMQQLTATPSGGKDSFTVALQNYRALDEVREAAAQQIITLEKALGTAE